MEEELFITPSDAQVIIKILQLENEATEKDIQLVLTKVHQIPGYEKINDIGELAQDRELFITLSRIAREEIAPPNTPKDLEKLIEDEEKRSQGKAEAEAKQKKVKRDPTPRPVTPPQQEPVVEEAEIRVEKTPEPTRKAPISPAARPTIVVPPVALSAGESLSKFAFSLITAPAKFAIEIAGPELYKENPTGTSSLTLFSSFALDKTKIPLLKRISQEKGLGISEKQFDDLAARLGELEKSGEFLNWIKISNLGNEARMGPQWAQILESYQGTPNASLVIKQSAFGLKGLLGNAGQQLLGEAGKRIVKGFFAKALQAGTTAAAEAGAGAAAGATFGAEAGTAVAPGPGTIIGAVVGFLTTFVPSVLSWLNEHKEEIIGVVLVGTGLLIGGIGGLVLGAGGVATWASKGVGFRGLGTKTSNFVENAITGITQIALPSIGIPLIIAIVSVPIVTALILFIIQSGAYLVPSSTGAGTGARPRGPGFNSCWPADAVITQDDNPNHLVYNLPSLGGQGSALDIGCSFGDTIYSPFDGQVFFYSPGNGPLGPKDGAGYYAIVQGTSGINAGLLHLLPFGNRAPPVKSGDNVQAGQPVAYCDHTGNVNGTHLHYEVWGASIGEVVPPEPPQPYIPYQTVVNHNICTSSQAGPNEVGPDFATGVEGVSGWVAITPLNSSNIVVSSPSEYGQQHTCEWADRHNLFAAVNANFYDTVSTPLGPAGYNGEFTNYSTAGYTSRFQSFLSFEGSSARIAASSSLPEDLATIANLNAVVSGVSYDSVFPEENYRRTALGIGQGKLFLVATRTTANRDEVEAIMESLGATQSFILDSDVSVQFCSSDPSVEEIRTGRVVSVNIGITTGLIRKLVP